MVNWVESTKGSNGVKGDVSITFLKNRERVSIKIKSGVWATKFRHCEKLMIGFDDNGTRIYFAPAGSYGGYTITKANGQGDGVIAIKCDRFSEWVKPADIIGDYILQVDEENNAYYAKIGASSVRKWV